MTTFAAARLNMVESQVRPNGITDHRIIDAMARVKREDYVPAGRKTIAYLDEDVLLKEGVVGEARYLIEPMAFARMIHLALIKPTERVLVVGAATGYGAKVISMLAQAVVGLESDRDLADLARHHLADCTTVQVVEGPLAAGHAAGAPYDVIIVEGRIAAIPDSLFGQLANNGRIVAAVGNTDVSKMQVATMTDGHRSSRFAFDVSIAPLPGFPVEKTLFVF
jgi:protein-L-isoaspartate(D-aspartate) O-methyltransferase